MKKSTKSRQSRFKAGAWLVLGLIGGLLGLSACGDATVAPGQSAGSAAGSTTGPAVVATTAAVATDTGGATAQTSLAVKAEVGYLAPDFSAKTVAGQSLRLNDLRGRAVILNYWAVY